MNYFKYTLWPIVKIRLRFWWWVIKYRGKKNIPPELVFGKVVESMQRMNENLQKALQNLPADATQEETKEFIDLIRTAARLEEETKEIGRAKREGEE